MLNDTITVHLTCCLKGLYRFPHANDYSQSHFKEFWTAEDTWLAFFQRHYKKKSRRGGLVTLTKLSGDYDESDYYMRDMIEEYTSLETIENALRKMTKMGLLESIDYPKAAQRFRILNPAFDTFIENRKTDGELDLAIKIGYEPVIESIKEQLRELQDAEATSGAEIPASDRAVSLDDNRKEVDEIKEHLTKLNEAVKEEGTNDFEQKEAIIGELDTSISQLSGKSIVFEWLKNRIQTICLFLVQRFSEKTLGEIAKTSWEKILEILSSL